MSVWSTIYIARIHLLLLCQALLWENHTTLALETVSMAIKSIYDTTSGLEHPGTGAFAVVAIAIGAILCFAGFKFIRVTLFVCGFAAGGISAAYIVEELWTDRDWIASASWAALGLGGLICGALVIYLFTLGIFISGAVGGVLLAIAINSSFGYKIYPSDPDTALMIWAIFLGFAAGFLAIRLMKPVLIVVTSAAGACLLLWGIGYFAGGFPNASELNEIEWEDEDDWVDDIPATWWAYVAGWLVLLVLGIAIQFRTARRHRHTQHGKRGYIESLV